MFIWLVRFLTLGCLVCSLGLLSLAHAQTGTPSLKPQAQTIGGRAFGAGGRTNIAPTADGIAPSGDSGSAETSPTATSAPFTYLMVRWRASTADEQQVLLEVRASEDGQDWTPWGKVHQNEDMIDPADPADVYWSNTIYTGLANFWQLRVTLNVGPDGTPPVLHEVRILTLDSRGADPQPRTTGGAAPAGAVAQPAYVSRAAWGGVEVRDNSVAPTWYRANHLVLHHTADSNSLRSTESSWADRVRAEWSFHTYSRGWGDVGYNWLVSPNGVLYEGRNGSSSLDQDSVGFHDTGNYGSMGVVMLGTFGPGVPGVDPITPTAAAQDGVVRLFAWKASQRGIDPRGRSYYYGCDISVSCKPYNPGAVVANIAGHRDVTPRTSCPGDLAMNLLDSIRNRVQDTLGGTPPPPPPTNTPTPPTATRTPTAVPIIERAELTNVQYLGSPVDNGGVIQVRFTVRNTGNVTLETQGPAPGSVNDIMPGHVYEETECFLGNGEPSSYPRFPKETRRLRIGLSGRAGASLLGANCAGGTGDYPWRWGLGDALRPGEARTVVGYVRFRSTSTSTRSITLRPTLIYEYVQYFDSTIGETTIQVTPERGAPEVSAMDATGMPLASVYRLKPSPWMLVDRPVDSAAVQAGEYVGSFAWDGSTQDWGFGGPFGLTDQFVVAQVRPFVAPQAGTYVFELTTDDGSWLWIDGMLVVAHPGLHGATSISGSIWLAAGMHTLAVKYLEYVGPASARYSWKPSGVHLYSSIPAARTLSAPQRGMVYGAGEQVILAADDLGGLGIRTISYSINNGPEQSQSGNLARLSLADGTYSVIYRATNYGGVQSTSRQMMLQVDTVPPETTLAASLRPDGVILLAWNSSQDAQLFELESFDSAMGSWQPLGYAAGRALPFFGKAGHTYRFRIRGSDGLNWETVFKEAPGASITVPQNVQFERRYLPSIAR